MELNPKKFDKVFSNFKSAWPVTRIKAMTVEEYANLSNHDSFCYWLEYGTNTLGAIGAVALHKFEIWKPKDTVSFKDHRFIFDGVYAWNAKKGKSREIAFEKIRGLILEIIYQSQNKNWAAIDKIKFHAIVKWKIAFLFSNNLLLPIYSRRAFEAISQGMGREFPKNTAISQLQKYILEQKPENESIDDYAFRLYGQFALKKGKRNYYIIGSKYGGAEGGDFVPVIEEFIKNKCVAIGFLDWIDFSSYMGADKKVIEKLLSENWKNSEQLDYKLNRTFWLFSQIKAGDIIAVKSHGSHGQLTIIAYAEVVERNGSVYSHVEDGLGHHIHVEFLDAGFYKKVGLNYAETIHNLSPKKDGEKFYKIFGWYVTSLNGEDRHDEDHNNFNEKREKSFERRGIASVTVNLIHNRIQNRFIKYLKKNYPNEDCSGEKNRIDAKRENELEVYIYEIKPFERVYSCVRDGIGQLLDYSHQLNTKKVKNIFIVGPNKPNKEDLEFISSIKSQLNIPFKYMAFDENSLLVNEY